MDTKSNGKLRDVKEEKRDRTTIADGSHSNANVCSNIYSTL